MAFREIDYNYHRSDRPFFDKKLKAIENDIDIYIKKIENLRTQKEEIERYIKNAFENSDSIYALDSRIVGLLERNVSVKSLSELVAYYTEEDLLKIHSFGVGKLQILKDELKKRNLHLKAVNKF